MTDTFEYRYQVTRDGTRVGWVRAQFHGVAVWDIQHPAFVDRTVGGRRFA